MKYKPIYHFTADKGWINDPNGLFYYKGVYHLCFQHNTRGNYWDIDSWGHATSKDMIDWTIKEPVIWKNDKFAPWSGTAIVDERNVTGLKYGEEDPILIFFTAYPLGQMMYYSLDGGETFKEYGVVLKNKNNVRAEDRDPKVFYHKESNKYIMVLYTYSHSVSGLPSYGFFSSENLLDWTFESEITNCFEVPEMVELEVEERNEKKWVLISANGDYQVGDFDGHRFIPVQGKNINQRNYHENCTYSWMHNGRTSMIGWIYSNYDYSEKWKNFYSVVYDLSLRFNKGKYELLREPVKELDKYKKEILSLENVVIKQGESFCEKYNTEYPHGCEVDIEVEYNPFNIICITTPCGNVWYDSINRTLQYNDRKDDLFFSSRCVTLEPENGVVKFKIFTDKTTIEIFADRGNIYMPYSAIWEKEKLNIYSVGNPDDIKIKSLKVYVFSIISNK